MRAFAFSNIFMASLSLTTFLQVLKLLEETFAISYWQCFMHYYQAFRIHLILTWIRIRILGSTFGKSGSRSGSSVPPFRNSGSGSSDPHLEKVDPDPVPKWIRIRVPIFHIFHKEIHVGQITMLILLPPKFRKGISQITKTFSFTFYST